MRQSHKIHGKCSIKEASVSVKARRVMVNVFFNQQRKCETESVANDRVVPFNKLKALNLLLTVWFAMKNESNNMICILNFV